MKTLNIEKEIRKNKNKYVKTLKEFVQQPSISADGTGIEGMVKMITKEMNKIGISTRLLKSSIGGNPVILGTLNKNNGYNLLVYGHYDVHPVGDPNDWDYEPFSAEIIGNKIIGRGTADNKGNFLSWIKAVEILKDLGIDIPFNIIFFFEGEEEIGSPNLENIIRENEKYIPKLDAKIVFEPRQDSQGHPFLNLGWKGMLSLKVIFKNKGGQIHASYGSLVSHPIFEMVKAINKIYDGNMILLPDFYNDIISVSREEEKCIEKIGWSKKDIVKGLGGESIKQIGLSDKEIIKTLLLEPSMTISAVSAGSVIPPVRSVIPGSASFLIEFRLVPNQNCHNIYQSFVNYLENMNLNCHFKVNLLATSEPTRTSVRDPFVEKIRKACNSTFNCECYIYPNLQGTSPDHLFKKLYQIPSLGCGCGFHHLCHRPNEYITIEQYMNGIELATKIILELSN